MDSDHHNAPILVQPMLPDYDYVSPGLEIIIPDAAFPNMVVGDTSIPKWPWLRRWVEQNWYTDRRNPDVGFASRDEASILYNNALLFRGKPCLEVGCWRGWSAVHLALGAGELDIIDPIFADPDFLDSARNSFEIAGVLGKVSLHTGCSPAAIDELSKSTGKRWSLIFIDADHEGDAPRKDAEAAIRHAADTAMVLFHDLASPYVAAGLDEMRDAGWQTMVYQTMQIMGVAWRGDVRPIHHIPDPRVFWTLPRHLTGYKVSGWQPMSTPAQGAWWPNMLAEDRWAMAMMRAQGLEDDFITAIAERDAAVAGRDAAIIERDAAKAARDTATAERDLAIAERQAGIEHAVFAEQRLSAAIFGFANWIAQKRVLLGMLRRSQAGRARAMRAAAAAWGSESFVNRGIIADLCQTRVLIGLLRRPAAFCHAMITARLREAAHAQQSAGVTAEPAQIGPPKSFRRNPARFDSSRENIILAVHETSRTGAPILGWNIARLLAARYNIFTVCLGGGELTPEFEALSAETHGPFFGSDRNVYVIEDALRPMFENRSFRYAIINSTESRFMLKICAKHSIPTIFLVHEFGAYVYAAAELRRGFEDAVEIVFPARLVAESSEKVHPALQRRKVNILPQGMSVVPPGTGSSNPDVARKLRVLAEQRADGTFVVIGAGSVSLRKGVDLFISAAAAVRQRNPKRRVHFVWVGHGYAPAEDMAYSIYLKEQVERSDLLAEVTFLGEVSDLEPVYALADAFFLSSRLDPLPNVSIDAAIRGIPIVCFADASGIAELLLKQPETAACVVAHLDVDAAAQLICRLASDAAAAGELRAATSRFAQETFDMETYVEKLDALGRRHGPPALEISSDARDHAA
jgi:glycosyltransferase involved in cell wall biosynthesis/predicted O-methyltransferase YrrM